MHSNSRPTGSHIGLLRAHPLVEIPDSVLHGPWSEEKVKRLFWITRAGVQIRWTDSTTGEVYTAPGLILDNLGQVLWLTRMLGRSQGTTHSYSNWKQRYTLVVLTN